jgi:meso-butanediol dehydrogenase/(S,S)-butanediol dehydrogenase/diacetyl reductase
MLQSEFTQAKDAEAVKKAQIQPLLIKRFGTSEEMADIALFLATESSSYMSGALLVADGGATAWYGM